MATDSKPVRDVLGHCLKPLADVIRAEQLKLKTSQGQKLEKYLIPLASVHADPAALITLSIMFNAISRSEFNEGTAPGVTSVVFEVGERCRIERSNDCEQPVRFPAQQGVQELNQFLLLQRDSFSADTPDKASPFPISFPRRVS